MWGGDTRISLIVACRLGNITDFSSYIWYSLSLVELCAGQLTSRFSSVPGVSVQMGAIQKPLLFLLQCLQSMSLLYLPEAILARMVLFEHSKGLLADEVHK